MYDRNYNFENLKKETNFENIEDLVNYLYSQNIDPNMANASV